MYIREIHINKFRHLENVHVGPFPAPPERSDLIVMAGPNGGGKSSVLELLTYALSNTWSLSWSAARALPENSFEVALGITSTERELVREYVKTTSRSYGEEVDRYFDDHSAYYRGYNYDGGKYQESQGLYNQVHSLVTDALRNHYERSLGFFLKSDRTYPALGFQREKLFQFDEFATRDYIWDKAFNTSDVQYRDMFDFLVQLRYHYYRRLGVYHDRVGKGENPGQPPDDPLMPYVELFRRLFPGYEIVEGEEAVPRTIYVQLPSGTVIPFGDLSSGEKEVFFVLSFFLRHNVERAVIAIDEPELHLHPEFARVLVRTTQSIRPGNQIWVATHNAEIIDEAGIDRVFYLTRDAMTHKSLVTPGTNEEEAAERLREMFGYSGYIGLARYLVFLEGEESGTDRKVLSSLFPESGSRIKFVPCASVENLGRVNTAVLSILEAKLGWMEFYLIRDRDYLTDAEIEAYEKRGRGRLRVLRRNQIENYLINVQVIARVERDLFGKDTSADEVRAAMRKVALGCAGPVLRDMVEYRLNRTYRPQDFSLGKFMEGETAMSSEGKWDRGKIERLGDEFLALVQKVNNELGDTTSEEEVLGLINACAAEIEQSFGENEGFLKLLPGRMLLEKYAKDRGLGKSIILQNSLIRELSGEPEGVPAELSQIMDTIVAGGEFGQE